MNTTNLVDIWHIVDIADFFRAIPCVYVVLRNYEDLQDVDSIDDIDILCADRAAFLAGTGAQPAVAPDNGYNYYVLLSGRKVYIDLRVPGDGYYCEKWERDMLQAAVWRDFYYGLDDVNYAFSYYYHVLIHKRNISLDRREKVVHLFATAGLAVTDKLSLVHFMLDRGYCFTVPQDKGVELNKDMLVSMQGLWRTG